MRRQWSAIAIVASLCLVASPAFGQGEAGGESDEAAASETDEGASEASETETDSEEPTVGREVESSAVGEESESEDSEELSIEETDTDDTVDTSAGSHPSTSSIFVAAPHVGVMVPSLFNGLGTWPIFSLEVGVIPPMEKMNNPLEIALLTRYTQPGATGEGDDPNLGESRQESYNWSLTQRTLTLDLVGIWRGRNLAAKLDPYGLIGPRVNFMETTMTAEGNGGNQFGEVRETNVEFGLVFGGGVDYQLGPGTAFGELKFAWSNLDQTLTGDTNAGAFVIDLGYRFYPF